KVLFVPAATPPHKASPVTEAHHRFGMLERALSGEPFFEVSRLELDRGGRSYTIDTLEAFAAESKDSRFFFVTGTDAFSEIRTWKSWQKLLDSHWFVVHERPGFPIEDVQDVLPEGTDSRVLEESELEPETEPRVLFLRRPMLQVSSTEIRRSIRENRSIRFLVPDAVAAYIRENRLYRY
ncbi:MAG: nicotinate-nucleotide adenylyltransferase, partial [Vicinamibacteria bacterium]